MTFLAHRRLAAPTLLACGAALSGCAPTLDWRDVRVEGSGLRLQMPCKPDAQRRDLPLAGARVNLTLYACAAGGQTWGLGFADVGDPARVASALAGLAAAAVSNLDGRGAGALPMQVAGATPNANSARQLLHGRLPDGKPMQMQVAVFTRGTLVFQATVLGAQVPTEAAQTYFASLRFGS